MARVTPASLEAVKLADFSGGLNYRDSLSELAENETPACKNVIFDERGGVAARLGMSRLNGSSALPADADYLYYSAVADALLAYISTTGGVGKVYKSTDGGTTWSALTQNFTSGAHGAIVDFNNRVVVVNTIDGAYSFPAGLGAPTHTTGGTNNMETAKGSAVAVWQNKVWVGGLDAKLMWSDAGDETKWTIATNFNQLREIDDERIVAIGIGQGVDAQNKPALFVAKTHSCYRVNDSGTGAYTTLHSGGAGVASSRAVASVLGLIVFINDRGVWVTDGIATPRRVSDALAPLFSPTGINIAAQGTWSAGAKLASDTVVFAITRVGSNTPNELLEYHPAIGWFTRHTFGLGAMAAYTKGTKKLIASGSDAAGKVFEAFKGGLDDGNPFTAEWQSRWFELAGGLNATLRKCRAWGRGNVNFGVLTDFTRGQGDITAVEWATISGGSWDSDTWDGSLIFGESLYEGDADIPLDEVGRYFSVKVSATINSSATGPPIADGSAPEIGAWALYEMLLQFVPRS